MTSGLPKRCEYRGFSSIIDPKGLSNPTKHTMERSGLPPHS